MGLVIYFRIFVEYLSNLIVLDPSLGWLGCQFISITKKQIMKKPFCANFILGIILLFFSLCVTQLSAATILAAATGNWNSAATWTGGVVPGLADDVIIRGNFVVTVTASVSCKSVLIQGLAAGTGTSTLLIGSGNTLSVTGNVDVIAGTSTSPSPYFSARLTNNGTLTVGGNVVLNTSDAAQYGYCYFDQGAGITSVAGNFTASGYSASQSSNITFTGAGAINLTGTASTLTLNANSSITYGAFAGTVELTGDNSNLNIAGGVFNMGTGTSTLKLSGALTSTGTFTKGVGTVIYQGTVGQTITALNYHNLSSTGSGARTITAVVGISGAFTKGTSTYATAGSTINFNGTGAQFVPVLQYNNLTISGARTTNQVTLDNSDTIKIGGALANTSTYTTGGSIVSTGTVICYDGTGAQTVSAFPYNDLTINKPQGIIASTANSNVVVGGNCTVISGVLSIGTGASVVGQLAEYTFSGTVATSILDVKDGATLTILGTSLFPSNFPKTLWKNIILNPNSTVNYAAAGAQTITDYQYGNLMCSGTAGTRTLAPTGSIKVAGTFTPNSGTFNYTITGSTIDYNGAAAQTIAAFNYNNLTVSNAPANITLAATGTIGIAGAFAPNAVSFGKITGSIIDYNATTAQTVSPFNYNNLTISGNRTSNAVTLSPTGLIQVAGALANTAVFSSGAIVNTGSTIVYNGTAAQSVIDFPYNNLSINKTGTASLTANLTATNLKGNLAIEKDTLATAGFTLTGSATKILSITEFGVLNISGTTAAFPTGFTTVTLDPKSWVVYSSTAAQTIAAQNYGNLKSTNTGARTLAATGIVGVATDFISGTNTYTTTGSTVEFNGTSDQSLSGGLGSSTNSLNNLNINNSGTAVTNGLTLSGNVTVAGVVNMKEGQLFLNGKTLVVSNSAVGSVLRTNGFITSESVDNSSKVQWNIGTTVGEHVIPFGKSTTEYLPFKFNLTSGDASNITVSTYATSAINEPLPVSPVVTGIDQQGSTDAANTVVDRFWNVSASTAAARTATLSFDFLLTEQPASLATPKVQSWNGVTWDPGLTGQTVSANSISVPNVTTFSTFAIYDNSVPVAAFTADVVKGCVGTSIQYSDNSLPNATNWNWSFPGGTPATSTAKNPVVVYNTNGVHDATLQVSNFYGNTSLTKTGYITIGAPDAPTVSNNGPVCDGSPINFTATSEAGATYSWTGPNGYSSTQQNPTIPFASTSQSGTYSVTSKLNGCSSAPATQLVTVNPIVAPSVSIASSSSSNSFCSGTTATYAATPVNGGTTPAYQWKVNGVDAGTDNPTFTSNGFSNGNTISCTMTSNATCAVPASANSAITTITINPTVTPSVSISGANEICSGTPATFTAAPADGGTSPTYQWKVDGVNAGTNSSMFTSSTLTNGNMVSCEMISNASCATTVNAVSSQIEMIVSPTVVPAVTVQLTTGTDALCSGETVSFIANPTNGGSTPVYDWKVNNVSTGVTDNVFSSSSFANMDKVICVMTSNSQCLTSATATSTSITVSVNPIPDQPVISQNGLVLTSDQTVGNQWYLDGVLIVSATNQTYTVVQNGIYTVVASLNGCQSPSSDAKVINNVGIGEIARSGVLSVGPNPTTGLITIKQLTAIQKQFNVSVYNAVGELVYTGNDTNSVIDIGNQGAGIYTLHIEGIDFALSQKIIKL